MTKLEQDLEKAGGKRWDRPNSSERRFYFQADGQDVFAKVCDNKIKFKRVSGIGNYPEFLKKLKQAIEQGVNFNEVNTTHEPEAVADLSEAETMKAQLFLILDKVKQHGIDKVKADILAALCGRKFLVKKVFEGERLLTDSEKDAFLSSCQ